MERLPRAQLQWPGNKPESDWNEAERLGVQLNPIATGIGSTPRTVADEDWVLTAEEYGKKHGAPQLMVDLVHLLRESLASSTSGSAPETQNYPERKMQGEIPLPNCAYPGDRDWQENPFNEASVRGMISNPIYLRIQGVSDGLMDDDKWFGACLKSIREDGLRQYLVNFLYQLRKSVLSLV
jgi:hypothetical protein